MATVEFRYDPKNTAWFTANAAMVLKAGEPAYHDTTGLFKLGDGVTALSALSFLPTVSASTPTIQQVLTAGQVATTTIETTGFIKTGGTSSQFLKADGSVDSSTYLTTLGTAATSLTTTGSSGASTLIANVLNVPNYTLAGLGGTTLAAVNAQNLSVFAATTSSELAGVISDETGTGALVFGTSPTFTTSIITPNVTGVSGNLVFTNAAQSSGAITNFTFTAANHTTQTASANIPTVSFTLGTLQRNTGAVTAQHGFLINSPTYSFVGASTITNAYSLFVNAPTVGTNATITNNYAAGFNGRVSQEGLGSSTFFGSRCGIGDDLTANLNTGFGADALLTNIVGAKNCAFGYFALRLATGSFNVAVGTEALQATTTGAQNVAIGNNTLLSNQTGTGNTAVGDLSLFQTTGGSNTGVGKNTLYDHTSGTFNTAIGWNTGRGIITGGSNTIIGAQVTGLSSTLANNVIIADGAGNKVLWFNSANALISDLKIDTTTGIKIGTTNLQKLSFWNATPIVQPTTAVAAATVVSGTGGNVKHDDTFDGYTVEKIVRALRTIGLLA